MLVASIPGLGAFARHQVRRKRAGATPLVEPAVLPRRSSTSGIVFAVALFSAVSGIMLFLGVLLQAGLGSSPLEASPAMAPAAA
jgi:hypothetical protein